MVSTSATLDRPTTPTDDQALLRSLQLGDAGAIAEVWRRHSATVICAARRIVRSEALAQEIAQDVFTTLWMQSERIDLDRGSILTFLRVVTKNRAVDMVRREVARRRREERVWANSFFVAGPDDPIDLVVRDELVHRVRAAVAELPGVQRESVELAWFGGLTYREVAISLGIPEGTAKSRIRDGFRRVSRALTEDRLSSAR